MKLLPVYSVPKGGGEYSITRRLEAEAKMYMIKSSFLFDDSLFRVDVISYYSMKDYLVILCRRKKEKYRVVITKRLEVRAELCGIQSFPSDDSLFRVDALYCYSVEDCLVILWRGKEGKYRVVIPMRLGREG